jgi:probable H4MPT-linked C1 transfer pathway protein
MPAPSTKDAPVLGLDVGGANLKAAHANGFTRHVPFALWKNPAGLAGALQTLLAGAPPHDALAVTMTGELCDCFSGKRQGVAHILDAVEAAAAGRRVRVYTTAGVFVDAKAARARPLEAASANWLALASFAGRFAPQGPALLIDVGTTTTDVIGLTDGKPAPQGRTDPERLASSELVYRGWRRTPLCALMGDGAAEFFATTHDVYLVLQMVAEDATDTDTADGQPATRDAAHRRLARMLCADLETSTHQRRQKLAELLNMKLVTALAWAMERRVQRLPGPPRVYIGSGSGEFLLPMVFHNPVWNLPAAPLLSLADRLGKDRSAAACAYAAAVLCAEAGG